MLYRAHSGAGASALELPLAIRFPLLIILFKGCVFTFILFIEFTYHSVY